MNLNDIITFLDDYLTKSGRQSIEPVEANAILAKAGLLRDSKDRPGKPLRDLLRKGLLPHAFQSGGKGSSWTIPNSKNGIPSYSKLQKPSESGTKYSKAIPGNPTARPASDNRELKIKLENARLRYKPVKVKYILVAEAPPDSLERFFYYENVRQHDYLFLGVAQALYPAMKEKFLSNGRSGEIKKAILEKFKKDGFYLLDLSELPLSLLNNSLESQLPHLFKKISQVREDDTKIILIKANVYDTIFPRLQAAGITNVIDVRIPFPGQGGQKRFQIEFKKALEGVGYVQRSS